MIDDILEQVAGSHHRQIKYLKDICPALSTQLQFLQGPYFKFDSTTEMGTADVPRRGRGVHANVPPHSKLHSSADLTLH